MTRSEHNLRWSDINFTTQGIDVSMSSSKNNSILERVNVIPAQSAHPCGPHMGKEWVERAIVGNGHNLGKWWAFEKMYFFRIMIRMIPDLPKLIQLIQEDLDIMLYNSLGYTTI